MNAIIPTYQQVSRAIQKLGSDIDPSETHGLLTGVICSGSLMDGKSWLNHLTHTQQKETKTTAASRAQILELYRISFERLNDDEFNFDLLLPSDTETLNTRAEALTNWCKGFLTGLSIAGIDIKTGVSEESADALYHLVEIAKLDFEEISITEQDEMAFFEVSEYVRLSAMVIFTEIHNWLDDNSKQETTH